MAIGKFSVLTLAIVMIIGGWNWVHDLLDGHTADTLATVRYYGEWSYGEYRECISLNLPEQEKQPTLECSLSPSVEEVFKVGFFGNRIYDEDARKGTALNWLCRRNDSDPSFSCISKESMESERKSEQQSSRVKPHKIWVQQVWTQEEEPPGRVVPNSPDKCPEHYELTDHLNGEGGYLRHLDCVPSTE